MSPRSLGEGWPHLHLMTPWLEGQNSPKGEGREKQSLQGHRPGGRVRGRGQDPAQGGRGGSRDQARPSSPGFG